MSNDKMEPDSKVICGSEIYVLYSVISECLNMLTSDQKGPCLSVCVCVCMSVCLSVEALAPKRLDGFQRSSGFEIGQGFANDIFFDF